MRAEATIEVVGDHFQVLLGDERLAPMVDTSRLWDAPGRVAAMPGSAEILGLGTARQGGVFRLTVRIEDAVEPTPPGWKVLGAFDLDVPSGRLVVWGPELDDIDVAPRVDIPAGRWRGMACSRGEDAVLDEFESTGPDEYLLVLAR